MEFDPSRLRRGELIVGASAVALLACMLVLPWYGLSGAAGRTAQALGLPTSLTGWRALTDLRWLMLVTIALALALVVLQATQRAPALPVTMSVIVTVFGSITVIALVYRVLINPPGDSFLSPKAGAYLGLISALGIAYGGYASMRQEGLSAKDVRTDIPAVKLRGTQQP
jgi:hypothetical protein